MVSAGNNRGIEFDQFPSELIGQGVATGQMAEQLNLSVKTIETHQAHIKKKLGLGSAHELNQRAIRWVMEQES